jgi:hypothetical protein
VQRGSTILTALGAQASCPLASPQPSVSCHSCHINHGESCLQYRTPWTVGLLLALVCLYCSSSAHKGSSAYLVRVYMEAGWTWTCTLGRWVQPLYLGVLVGHLPDSYAHNPAHTVAVQISAGMLGSVQGWESNTCSVGLCIIPLAKLTLRATLHMSYTVQVRSLVRIRRKRGRGVQ